MKAFIGESAGRRRGSLFVAAFGCLMALAVAGPANPAGAKKANPVKLTIHPYLHGVAGHLSGPVAKRCGANRVVQVFKSGKRRAQPVGRAKLRLIREKSHPDRGRYLWKVKTRKTDRMFARLTVRKGCRQARSRTIKGLPRRQDGMLRISGVPDCPQRGILCRLNKLHFKSTACPPFATLTGGCEGTVQGLSIWTGSGGHFEWSIRPFAQPNRTVAMDARPPGTSKLDWQLYGWTNGPEGVEWHIENAYNRRGAEPNLSWRTQDLAVKPGEPGGPLSLSLEEGPDGTDVYVYGYLYMKN